MEQNPYLESEGELLRVTDAGHEYLADIVTDTEGPVYAFRDAAPPIITAAAMARLSRRGTDLRQIYLDEFALVGEDDAEGLIKRVVTAYGDDSVQQLVGQHVVVENASNLLTKKLEWGRFGSYLEQSTRYIYFDEKDAEGNYKYFIPENLSPELCDEYRKTLDQIFDTYSGLVRGLTDYVRQTNPEPSDEKEKIAWKGATRAQACDAVRPILPVATKSTVGIFASAQAMESMVVRLLSEDLLEARKVGKQILTAVRQVMPAFFERADKPDRGGATTAYLAAKRDKMREIAKDLTSDEAAHDPVKLVDFWPENELDVVPHLLFAESDLSTEGLKKAASQMPEDQKKQILHSYMGERLNRRHRPGRSMEIPHYMFEVTADYGTFRDLQRHRVVDAFEWQNLSTKYGYDVPELLQEAGMTEEFEKCFELSERLADLLTGAGFEEEAQYVTLLGHRMRYRFMVNAREAFHLIELRTSPQGHPGYRKLAKNMYDLIHEVHPEIANSMRFINKGEDPELTRMAAELATQYKLGKLDAQNG